MAVSGQPPENPVQAMEVLQLDDQLKPSVQNAPPSETFGREWDPAKMFDSQTWAGPLARDPFQPVAEVSPKVAKEQDIAESVSSSPAPDLHLEAVTVEGDRRFAVINHAIVSEGDEVEGHQVIRIDSDGVTVAGQDGRQRLVFGRKMDMADER